MAVPLIHVKCRHDHFGLLDCPICITFDAELRAWDRRTDQIGEMLDAGVLPLPDHHGWPIIDEAPTLIDLTLAMPVREVARA